MTHVILVGNPNCGKTTVFNALTGEHQRVGNWPGVTVEKKTGSIQYAESTIAITDLPGIYSLAVTAEGSSQDEKISAEVLVTLPFDAIINVIDACHLERHLYLTTQLLELNKPVVIALNMMDLARQRGITIDVKQLANLFNCPVIILEAHKEIGVEALKKTLTDTLIPAVPLPLELPEIIQEALYNFQPREIAPHLHFYYANRLLEGDDTLVTNQPLSFKADDTDVILADARYRAIHTHVQSLQKKQSDASNHLTARLDKIVLHRYLALPLFFSVMYLMFLFAINMGGAFQDFFDISSHALFVQAPTLLLQQWHAPGWLIALIANGIGVGICTTVTFIPVIAAMYFFLALLESSGYMARAAFVVDKLMRLLGLPGKSFVPMIVGFGCNVPAIMAARTLDSERDRLLTVLMSPFMSCSARLAIYAVFVSAFFPTGGQNIVFSLYMIGITIAVLTGFLLRKTLLQGNVSPLIIELPAYHKPKLARLLKEMTLRLRYFIRRAGRVIIPVCVILGGLNALTVHGAVSSAEADTHSILSLVGQWLTPIFSPMGLTQDNWPATVGLLTGMLAKEVVIGTLNTLYSQVGHLTHVLNTSDSILQTLITALWSIPENLKNLSQALINPISSSSPYNEMAGSVYGVMAIKFNGQAGAFAYLLFILLYIPCVSTMAVIRQEANSRWMWFSIGWSFLVAYATAVIFYQLAFFTHHPGSSILWVLGMVGVLGLTVIGLYYYSFSKRAYHVITNS